MFGPAPPPPSRLRQFGSALAGSLLLHALLLLLSPEAGDPQGRERPSLRLAWTERRAQAPSVRVERPRTPRPPRPAAAPKPPAPQPTRPPPAPSPATALNTPTPAPAIATAPPPAEPPALRQLGEASARPQLASTQALASTLPGAGAVNSEALPSLDAGGLPSVARLSERGSTARSRAQTEALAALTPATPGPGLGAALPSQAPALLGAAEPASSPRQASGQAPVLAGLGLGKLETLTPSPAAPLAAPSAPVVSPPAVPPAAPPAPPSAAPATATPAATSAAAAVATAPTSPGLSAEASEHERREARLRAIGRQLDEEAAQREKARQAEEDPRPAAWRSARRLRLFGRTDPNEAVVLYAEAWARRLQLNTPPELVRTVAQFAARPALVTVALRSDGSVESVSFVQSSGAPEVDAHIRRILQQHQPYAAFPTALATAYDVVEIRRRWVFNSALWLE